MQAAKIIISHWSEEFKARYGSVLPDDYTAFDTETTGFSRKKDVIVEWGHCIVRDRKVINQESIIVNWFDSGLVPDDYIEAQLIRVRKDMRAKGRNYRLTPEMLRKEGMPPDEFLPWLHEFIEMLVNQGEFLVSHNGWNFDVEMIAAHFRDFMGLELVIPDDQMFDTGAIVKASQMLDEPNVLPRPGETMKEYFVRICYWRGAGINWNLDNYCVGAFDLVERFGVDQSKAHAADYDSWMLHLLMETFREMLESPAPRSEPVTVEMPAKRKPPKGSSDTVQRRPKRHRKQRNR